mmetsp:Transcript_443/g.742  ORF Transcript_443/g.742 Transcript_443/m.742 type:complete len:116 (-) Transcript_443:222-569(-)
MYIPKEILFPKLQFLMIYVVLVGGEDWRGWSLREQHLDSALLLGNQLEDVGGGGVAWKKSVKQQALLSKFDDVTVSCSPYHHHYCQEEELPKNHHSAAGDGVVLEEYILAAPEYS